MKTFVKGMVLLLAGASFIACSKDVSFDENALKDAERAKAQAEVAQMIANYESGFVKHFGPIASGHKWGFDQARGTTTRTYVTSTTEYWVIPEDFLNGASQKEGGFANAAESAINDETYSPMTLSGFNFNNFWLQHIEQPDNFKNEIEVLEAYSTTNGWEPISRFSKGKNNSSFEFDVEGTYAYSGLNKSVKGAVLMTNMGQGGDPAHNNAKFRVKIQPKKADAYYIYDYGFFRTTVHDNKAKKDVNITCLAIELEKTNGKATSFWIIKLAEAELASEDVVEEGRIFCEDMGQQGDFDFNDVVFDAKIYKDNHIEIDVLAAGATLEIKIDGTVVDLGVNMANTGVNQATKSQKIIIPGENQKPKYAHIKDIPVEVTSRGGAVYALTATDGSVPQKVCTPIGTFWAKEYTSIELAYPLFTEYVNSETPDKWTQTFVEANLYK